MSTTAKKIIVKAFQKAGILTKTQQPSADEANDALDALNNMLSSWSNDTGMIYTRSWETFPLVGGQLAYTIGVGANFNTVRPIEVIECHLSDGIIDYPCETVNDEIYNHQIQQKTAPGLSYFLNYDNAFPIAKIRLWPVPPSSLYSLFLLTEKALTFYNLNDTVDLPPGWERALIFNLAIEICSDYGQSCPEETVSIATQSKSLIQKAIMRNRSLDAAPLNGIGTFGNIYAGWNSR